MRRYFTTVYAEMQPVEHELFSCSIGSSYLADPRAPFLGALEKASRATEACSPFIPKKKRKVRFKTRKDRFTPLQTDKAEKSREQTRDRKKHEKEERKEKAQIDN